MDVRQIIHPVFTSNTYILSDESEKYVWLIDVGNFEEVNEILSEDTFVKGVFITHYHYDHIYGINKLIAKYPNCVVYASNHTIEGLYSEKMNLSFYHESPIVFEGTLTKEIKGTDEFELFSNCKLEIIETPGHNLGCLTYKIGNYLFTGDSFIPNAPVVTKLKGGNKLVNIDSLIIIHSYINENTVVCSGHGRIFTGHELTSNQVT